LSTLRPAFERADVVVSLVGIMHGSPQTFQAVQVQGVENVAKAAQEVNAKLVHFSAIGANADSPVPYARTKALGEATALQHCSKVTIIRPSIVFGPEDDFFNVGLKQTRMSNCFIAVFSLIQISAIHARIWGWNLTVSAGLRWRFSESRR